MPARPMFQDGMQGGGPITLVMHAARQELVRDFISLNGTTNCADGLTPGYSWLTCEETTCGAHPGLG